MWHDRDSFCFNNSRGRRAFWIAKRPRNWFFFGEGCTKWENVFRMHLHHAAVTKFVSERQCRLWSQLFRRFCDGETNQKRERCLVDRPPRSFHAFHSSFMSRKQNFSRHTATEKLRPPWKLISFHAAPLLMSCLKLLIFVFCSRRAPMWKKTFAKLFVTLKNSKFSETIPKLWSTDAVTAGSAFNFHVFRVFGVRQVHALCRCYFVVGRDGQVATLTPWLGFP